MPGLLLPVQLQDESGNPPDMFTFGPALYQAEDLDGAVMNYKKGKSKEQLSGDRGYGELADPNRYAATQGIRLKFKIMGASEWESTEWRIFS